MLVDGRLSGSDCKQCCAEAYVLQGREVHRGSLDLLCRCADRDFEVQVGTSADSKPDFFKDGLFTVAAMLASIKAKTAARSLYILTNNPKPAGSSSSLR